MTISKYSLRWLKLVLLIIIFISSIGILSCDVPAHFVGQSESPLAPGESLSTPFQGLKPVSPLAQPPTGPSDIYVPLIGLGGSGVSGIDSAGIAHVSGPKTKGQLVQWPKANSRGVVQLPPDAWIESHQMVLCHDEPGCVNGIAIAVMRDNSKLKLWTLNGRVVDRGSSTIDAAKKSQLRAEFSEIFVQLELEVEASK